MSNCGLEASEKNFTWNFPLEEFQLNSSNRDKPMQNNDIKVVFD